MSVASLLSRANAAAWSHATTPTDPGRAGAARIRSALLERALAGDPCPVDHHALKFSEARFRRSLEVTGVQRCDGMPDLLLGNCPHCGSTISYAMESR